MTFQIEHRIYFENLTVITAPLLGGLRAINHTLHHIMSAITQFGERADAFFAQQSESLSSLNASIADLAGDIKWLTDRVSNSPLSLEDRAVLTSIDQRFTLVANQAKAAAEAAAVLAAQTDSTQTTEVSS